MKKSLKGKKGISLIVLVITIVVIIILAVAVILTVSSNNPVEKANEATDANNMAVLKEKYNMAYSDAVLEGTAKNMDKKEILYKALEEGEKKDYIIEGNKVIGYTGGNKEIANWLGEKFGIYEVDGKSEEMIEFAKKMSELKKPYIYNSGYLTGMALNGSRVVTTAGEILSGMEEYSIYNIKGEEIGDTDKVTTGYEVKKGNNKIATIIVFGDVDGLGSIDSIDSSQVYVWCMGAKPDMKKYEILSMDVNHDGYVTQYDGADILCHYVERFDINQNYPVKIDIETVYNGQAGINYLKDSLLFVKSASIKTEPYVTGIEPGIKVGDLLKVLPSSAFIGESINKAIDETEVVKGSNQIYEHYKENTSFLRGTIVIFGDLNCDGVITEADKTELIALLQDIEGYSIEDAGFLGADINGDGKLDSKDLEDFDKYLAGEYEITQKREALLVDTYFN